MLLVGASLVQLSIVPEASSASASDWWDGNWRIRIPLIVTNSANVPHSNTPLLFYTDLGNLGVASAVAEVRVLDGRVEVPSWILWEDRDGAWVKGAYLLLLLSIGANEQRFLQVYAGNQGAEMPNYRAYGDIADPRQIDQRIQPPTSVRFEPEGDIVTEFGSSLRIRDLVAVEAVNWGQRYGVRELNGQQAKVIEDWRPIGNLTEFGIRGVTSVYGVQNVTWVRIALWGESYSMLADLIQNTGSVQLGGFRIWELVDFTALASFGFVEGSYSGETFVSRVSGTQIGWQSEIPPLHFSTGTLEDILSEIRLSRLSHKNSATGAFNFAAEHAFGSVPPGGGRGSVRYLAMANNDQDLILKLNLLSKNLTVFLANPEYPSTPIPRVGAVSEIVWRLANVSFAANGESFDISAPQWALLPGKVDVSGIVTYQSPGEDAATFEDEDFWVVERDVSSQVSTFASSQFYAGLEFNNVGTVSIWNQNATGSGSVKITSQFTSIQGASRLSANLMYRANMVQLQPGSGRLGIRLGIDANSDSLVERWIELPVQDTYPQNPNPQGWLINDGQWRQAIFPLENFSGAGSFRFQIEISAASDPGFEGLLELDVAHIFLEVEGEGGDALNAMIRGSQLLVEPRVEANVTARDLTLFLLLARSYDGDIQRPEEFEWTLTLPDKIAQSNQNLSRFSNAVGVVEYQAIKANWMALAIHFGDSRWLSRVVVNGLELSPVMYAGRNVLLVNDDILDMRNLQQIRLLVFYNYVVVTIQVQDNAGGNLEDALVQVKDALGRILNSGRTNMEGTYVAYTVPGTYRLEIIYHNTLAASSVLEVSSSTTFRQQLKVYAGSLRVLDGLGFPVGWAVVRLERQNTTVAEGFTGADGTVSFRLISLLPYRVKVLIEGSEVLESDLTPLSQGQIVLLKTNYLPFSFRLILLASLPLIVAAIVVIARRRIPH